MKNIFFYIFFFLSIPCISLYAQNKLIKSDWVLEETEKPPISAIELDTREERVREFEAKRKAESEEIESKKEEIKSKRKSFIECLNEKGVILYSVDDCPACAEQRAYFGDDFKDIEYVDCKKARATCPLSGISTYPTWYLGSRLGIKKKGVKDLPALARLTGCPF